MAIISDRPRGRRQWRRLGTEGGKLVESQLVETLHMSRIKRRQIAGTQRKLLMKMNDNNNRRKKGRGKKQQRKL